MRPLSLLFSLLLFYKTTFAQVVTAQRPVTLFTLRAIDEVSGKEVPAAFKVFLHTADQRASGANQAGKPDFNVRMFHFDTVTVETASEGHFTAEEVLLVSCDTCGFYQYTALMEKRADSVFTNLKINDIIKLDKIHFD